MRYVNMYMREFVVEFLNSWKPRLAWELVLCLAQNVLQLHDGLFTLWSLEFIA